MHKPFTATAVTVSLTVTDLMASVSWYRDKIGFAVDSQHEREGKVVAVALKAGEIRLLLNQDNGAKGWERVKGEGFSLQFITDMSVDDVAARITANGGTMISEPTDMPWGVRMLRVADPDGYKLAISKPLKG